MKRLIKAVITFIIIMAGTVSVRAEEGDGLLVDISISSGESVLVRDGYPLYTSVPVTMKPVHADGEISYSICTDEAEGFGPFVRINGDEVILYPDDPAFSGGWVRIMFENSIPDEDPVRSKVYHVIFDEEAPQATMSDPEGFTGWFNAKQLLGINVHDASSGICRIVVKRNGEVADEMHYKDGEIQQELFYEYAADDSSGVNNTVDIECYDQAGNMSVLSFEYGFDDDLPWIEAGDVPEGVAASCDHMITLSAKDSSSDAVVDYVLERSDDDEVVTTSVASVPGGDLIAIDRDGKYHLTAWATDSAGNRSEKKEWDFAVDTEAPEVSISGVSEKVDAKSAVEVTVDVTENIPEHAKVDIILSRTALGNTEILSTQPYNLQAVHDTRTVNISSDGEYEISVCATDGAGNRAYDSRRFRIDSNAPDINVSGLREGEVTADIPTIRFNAGEMFYESTVLSAILEKKEKGGYKPVYSRDMVMRSARDHLDIQPEGEGRYRLTCIAADRSGNTSSSTVNFAIDHTPPVIAGFDEIDSGFFKSFTLPAKLLSYVTDASGFSADAYINDEKANEGDVIIREGKYVLTVIAEDEAGNVAESSSEFMVDHTGPQVVLSGFDREGNIKKGSMIRVALLEDCDRLESVRFNDRNILVEADNTAGIAVDDYGEYTLSVVASDPAGNVTDTSIHTSCYMIGKTVDDLLAGGRTVTANVVKNEKKDVDPAGLAIGLISVLAGTLGLTFRASSRH